MHRKNGFIPLTTFTKWLLWMHIFRNIEKRMKKLSKCLWFLCQLVKGCMPVMRLLCHLLHSPALRPPGPSSALGIAGEATFRSLCKWECRRGKEKPGNPPVRKSCTGTAHDSAVVYASSHVTQEVPLWDPNVVKSTKNIALCHCWNRTILVSERTKTIKANVLIVTVRKTWSWGSATFQMTISGNKSWVQLFWLRLLIAAPYWRLFYQIDVIWLVCSISPSLGRWW